MPECDVCGSVDFDLIGGFYFCNECQTQTQDIIEAVEEEDYQPGFPGHSLEIRTKTVSEVVRNADKGRPWKSHEGFQMILKEQVKNLINIGANQQLKDVVFQLWMQYLARVGVAFTEHLYGPSGTVPYGLARDEFPGSVENPDIIPYRLRKTYKQRKKSSKKVSEVENEKVKTSEDIEEDFYDDDNPFLNETESESSDSDEGKEKKYSHPAKHVGVMSLQKTLAICYLGLLCTNHAVTAADIIRWVEEGKVLYRTAVNIFHDDMKLGLHDRKTFCNVKIPKVSTLKKLTGQICSFLGVKNFALPQPDVMSSIFICKLSLPDELHSIVHKLISLHQPTVKPIVLFASNVVIPNYDTCAMAYIVLALKLMFGLDDFTERQLSSYARELSRTLSINQELFVWEDWFHEMERCAAVEKKNHLPEKLEDVGNLLKVEDCLHYYNGGQDQLKSSSRYNHCVVNRWATKQNLSKIIGLLMEKLKATSAIHQESQSYSRKVTTDGEEDLMDELLYGSQTDEGVGVDTSNSVSKSNALTNKSFSGHTVSYILDGSRFLGHKGNHRLARCTVESALEDTCIGVENEINEEAEEECIGQTPAETSRSQATNVSNEMLRTAISQGLRWDAGIMPDADSKIGQIAEKLSQTQNKYVFYKKGEVHFHQSYDWLLKLCSRMLQVKSEVLHSMVQCLESVFFPGKYGLKFYSGNLKHFFPQLVAKKIQRKKQQYSLIQHKLKLRKP